MKQIVGVKIIESARKKDGIKRLSDVEIRIMAVLWSSDMEFTTREIYDQCKDMDWKLGALMKQLDRLEDKGFLVSDRTVRRNTYKAIIPKKAYITSQVKILVDNLFDESAIDFIKQVLTNLTFTEAEKVELKGLIDVINDIIS